MAVLIFYYKPKTGKIKDFARFSAKSASICVNLRQIFNQKRSYLPAKIQKSKIFLTIFLTSSYEHRESRIEDFFQPNAQAEAIVEVPSGACTEHSRSVEGSTLLRGTPVFASGVVDFRICFEFGLFGF